MTDAPTLFEEDRWPIAVQAMREILGAIDCHRADRDALELDVWRRVVDGRPVFAWVAMQAFMRPGCLEARAAGYTLSAGEVRAEIDRGCFDRFEQAPEAPAVAGIPTFRTDLWKRIPAPARRVDPVATATEERAAIPCVAHAPASLAECGCLTAAEAMGVPAEDVHRLFGGGES